MAWRKLLREWRSGELWVLFVALLVAVGAMTAVSFFTDRVAKTVATQAAEVLAADLVLTSGREIDEVVHMQAEQAGLQTARRVSFPSVVLDGEQSALADIEGVSENYPLRGTMRIADSLLAEPRATSETPAPGEAWAESRLLAQLGVDVGVTLEVGEHRVTVTQVLHFAPDRGWRFSDLAPGLMIHIDDVVKTALIQPGSRVSWCPISFPTSTRRRSSPWRTAP